MSLVNKVAIVTGASSGIGAAIAVKLTEEGASVAIVGRNENKLKNVSKTCAELGIKPLIIVADVTKDDDAKRIISETINCFGKLDILVNNAGIGNAASILDEKVMEVYDKHCSYQYSLEDCFLLLYIQGWCRPLHAMHSFGVSIYRCSSQCRQPRTCKN